MTPLPGKVYEFALVRWQLSPISKELFIDRPNIFAYHRQLRNQEERAARSYAYDIVKNQLAVSWTSEVNPFLARVEQGIADANAEGLVIGQTDIAANTAEMFQVAKTQGIRWVRIVSNNKHMLKRLELNKEIFSLIENDLSNGFIVLVPERPVRMAGRQLLGFWRLDPIGGDILGIDERGWGGGTLTEYQVATWRTIGCVLGGLLITVGEVKWEPEKVNYWDIVHFFVCLIVAPATGLAGGEKTSKIVSTAVLRLSVAILGAAAGGALAYTD